MERAKLVRVSTRIGSPGEVAKRLTISIFVAPVKGPEGEDAQDHCTMEGCEVDDDKQGAENEHGRLEKIDESPLRLVIGIDRPDRPCCPDCPHQVFQRRAPRSAHSRGIHVQPICITLPRQLVGPKLAHKPAHNGCRSRR